MKVKTKEIGDIGIPITQTHFNFNKGHKANAALTTTLEKSSVN
jgi:hypothetical protein